MSEIAKNLLYWADKWHQVRGVLRDTRCGDAWYNARELADYIFRH